MNDKESSPLPMSFISVILNRGPRETVNIWDIFINRNDNNVDDDFWHFIEAKVNVD